MGPRAGKGSAMEYDEQADRLEQEADKLGEQGDRVGERI